MKTVVYTTSGCLPCSTDPTNTVVLCLLPASSVTPDEAVTPKPYVCGLGGGTAYEFTTIEATISQVYKTQSGCDSPLYNYVFTYDENQFVDPTDTLVAAQIGGAFCKGCATTWAKETMGNECYVKDNGDGTVSFVSQHGCEYRFAGTLYYL